MEKRDFKLHAPYQPAGDQPKAIRQLVEGFETGKDQQILSLDSMQGTTSEDAAGGSTYLSVMESNLEVLKEALK